MEEAVEDGGGGHLVAKTRPPLGDRLGRQEDAALLVASGDELGSWERLAAERRAARVIRVPVSACRRDAQGSNPRGTPQNRPLDDRRVHWLQLNNIHLEEAPLWRLA